eukprot:TRINITY_DN216_c1_g1_i8.p1 TRINITY_DN216_c1_g1~~TRINITY_DN216_c1_g1_i8.p1  ORF type:complete len:156 (-),score=3.26 TRINITY_DN216_c1_g1_i8:68-535(-)
MPQCSLAMCKSTNLINLQTLNDQEILLECKKLIPRHQDKILSPLKLFFQKIHQVVYFNISSCLIKQLQVTTATLIVSPPEKFQSQTLGQVQGPNNIVLSITTSQTFYCGKLSYTKRQLVQEFCNSAAGNSPSQQKQYYQGFSYGNSLLQFHNEIY